MCYESSQLAYRIYKDAQRIGASEEELAELKKKWHDLENDRPQFYYASGFDHPELLGFTKRHHRLELETFYWGLIPHWVKTEEQARALWNQTLNARGESIFEKASFRDAAENERIVMPLTGFYEHQYRAGKPFPYFIQQKNGENMLVGALAAEWTNEVTGELYRSASIVTTPGNALMAEIHNSPKLKGPRMPLLLDPTNVEQWMTGSVQEANELIRPNTHIELKAHTVRQLRGKEALGNCEKTQEEYDYPPLYEPPTLF